MGYVHASQTAVATANYSKLQFRSGYSTSISTCLHLVMPPAVSILIIPSLFSGHILDVTRSQGRYVHDRLQQNAAKRDRYKYKLLSFFFIFFPDILQRSTVRYKQRLAVVMRPGVVSVVARLLVAQLVAEAIACECQPGEFIMATPQELTEVVG